MKKNRDYLLGVMMALGAALLWSILPILLKKAANQFSPELIVFSRFSVAGIILYLYLTVSRKFIFHVPKNITYTLIAAIALSLNYLTYTLGVKYSGAANAGILIQSGSVFLTIFGIIFFKEKLKLQQVVGIILVFLGFSLFFHEKLNFSSALEDHYYGTIITLFSGFMWALYAVIAKLDKKNSSDSAFNLWVFTFGAILFYFRTTNADYTHKSIEDLSLLFALGLVTLLSYSALIIALKHIDAALVSVILVSEIVILLAILQIMEFLQIDIIKPEPITLLANAGAIIAVFGITLTIYRNKKKAKNTVL